MRSRSRKKQIAAISAGILAGLVLLVLFWRAASGSEGIKESLQNAAAAVTKPLYQAAGGIQRGFKGIFHFKEVTAENEILKKENEKLQLEKAALALTRQEKQELEELEAVFQYEAIRGYTVKAANVSAMEYSGWQGAFLIDKGSRDGVKPGCIVISGNGLVGKVTEVSAETAKVVSILSDDTKVSFQTLEKKGKMGVLQSDGKGGLAGYLLEDGKTVKKGTKLITSGIGTYPEGIIIGEITRIKRKEGTQRLLLEAKPSISFFKLRKVAVVL